ncbi:hypothetical protein MVES1_002873 [Malassezia vespertilionis]|uniref:Rrp7p n=1 Tax=Malassezia vespertilionis TaxID=2020962 RepID=A0A2N1JAF2_9BASI|nr:uncharacterized protein MVES1_002873 [Malassezia vespertilionis]PKI83524.1 Rrp7p [Malassezia vespertilionis]WFD07507.1 hypothetical protein MVES1_002873 [Malassezia vespertilionis]
MEKGNSVAGFSLLPVRYGNSAGYKFAVHYMYVREHLRGKEAAILPPGRTLFVVNLPTDATRGMVRALFRKAGAIEAIHLHNILGVDMPDDDEGDEEAYTGVPASTNNAAPNKSGPPNVIPLPALDPNMLLGSGSSAHIVFLDDSSLGRAKQLVAKYQAKPYVWPRPDAAGAEEDSDEESTRNYKQKPAAPKESRLVGLAYLLARHRMHRPPLDRVKQHADSAIARYSWIREHPQWLMEQRMHGDQTTSMGVGIQAASVGPDGALLDEDGFTIVQKGNKYGRSGGESSAGTFGAITPEFEELLRTNPEKKKAKELQDFYRYQFRERKRQQFATLRSQFEADKQKVAQRKASMRFKPY